MELLYQNLDSLEQSTFKSIHVKHPYHLVPLHYHVEIEIMYIVQGQGTRVVGDSVESFSPGDFVLVGSNTPHVWKSGKEHYLENSNLEAECFVLFIPPQVLTQDIFSIPEFSAIGKMLKSSKRGIKFSGPELKKLQSAMVSIFNSDGVKRILEVIRLLDSMSKVTSAKYLSEVIRTVDHETRDFDRLSRCVDYLLQNYDQKIELHEMADLANMTPNSFCRYFKKRTSKTFSRYLTDLRIGMAAKLLVETDKSVNQIAFESGFNSLSNFNDHFKKIKNQNPTEFRSAYRKLAQ